MNNLPKELVYMNGRKASRREIKDKNIAKGYKGEEIVENHGCPHPEV